MRFQSARIPSSCARLDGSKTRPHTSGRNPYVLETFQPYRVAPALSTLCKHRISTCFAQRGVAIRAIKLKRGELFWTTRRRSSACNGRAYSAHAEAEDGQISKDRWEVLRFAKPFRDFVPECGPRDPGSNGGLLNWMPEAAARMQANLNTQSLVLDCEVYTRTFLIVQGGIKRVT